MELKDERNADLLEAYDRMVKKLGPDARLLSHRFLVELTVNSPAKRFYVSAEEAWRNIKEIEKFGTCRAISPLCQMRNEAIYRLWLRRRHELRGLPRLMAVERVLQTPAERFYLETDGACVLFWNLMRKRNKSTK